MKEKAGFLPGFFAFKHQFVYRYLLLPYLPYSIVPILYKAYAEFLPALIIPKEALVVSFSYNSFLPCSFNNAGSCKA